MKGNKKLIEAHKGKKLSKEHKENIKLAWQNGCYDGVFKSPTKPEKEIMKILEDLNIKYIFQFRPKNYSKVYDFYIPKRDLLIEYDSKYWHSSIETKIRDAEKTKYAENNGYKLLRINKETLNNIRNNTFNKSYL